MPDDKAGLNQHPCEAGVVGELLEQAADLDARDSGGWATLHFAAQHEGQGRGSVKLGDKGA
jgi:hypothetical protein|tara:strand:+ start:72 stop:254 length:183 start_codon:yes stop_codon:yes gene_type:complete